jgi:hypothetical protein
MLDWICEKMATQESALGGGRFFAFGSIVAGNGTSAGNDLYALGEDCSIAVGNGSWDNAHTSDSSSKGETLNREPNALVQHAQCTGGSSDG